MSADPRDVPSVAGACYYVVGPRTAQDGVRVWDVVRSLEMCGRQVLVAEYMSHGAAKRAAEDHNAAALRAAGLAV